MGKRAYVGNIPFSVTESDLRQFFTPRKLTDVKIIMDKETQRPRGFAFVEFETEADMRAACTEKHETDMGGRRVVVSEAKDRDNRGGGGGGGRSNRDGEKRPSKGYDESWRD